MSVTINKHHVDVFTKDLHMLVEQAGSDVFKHLNSRSMVGRSEFIERLGGADATELTVRHGPTPAYADIAHSRRRLDLRTFHNSERVDEFDLQRVLIDPTNAYSRRLASALGRKRDDVILAAMYGSAVDVAADGTTSSVAFDTGMIIDEDFGTANSKLTVAKLIEMRRKLLVAKVDLKAERPICLVSPTDAMALLNDTQATSSDYAAVKALVDGEVAYFMGFNMVICHKLEEAAHLTGEGFARVIGLVPSAMAVRTGHGLKVKMGEDAGERFDTIIYAADDIGAVRVEEARIVIAESHRA